MMVSRAVLFITLLLLFCFPSSIVSLGCLNSAGVNTDWFFVSKAPGCADDTLVTCSPLSYFDGTSSQNNDATSGYLYFAPGVSAVSGSALNATLSQASRTRNSTTARLLWNDDPPCIFNPSRTCGTPSTTTGKTNAHSKGVLVADVNGGFWITHSWPEWPDLLTFAPSSGGAIGNASTIYGQSFLCISLNPGGVESIANTLMRAEPLSYDSFIPLSLTALYPKLTQIIGGTRVVTNIPTTLSVTSVGGLNFIFFSKNGAWGGELWSSLIGPTIALGSEMHVETWRRSPVLPSSCNATTGNILNVNTLTYNISNTKVTKSYTTDHSKYAISATPSWVCIGDINRMASQAGRGGGAVCFNHAPLLWKILNATFTSLDICVNSTPLRPINDTFTPSPTSNVVITLSASASVSAIPILLLPSSSSSSSSTAATSLTKTQTAAVLSGGSSSSSSSQNLSQSLLLTSILIPALIISICFILIGVIMRNRMIHSSPFTTSETQHHSTSLSSQPTSTSTSNPLILTPSSNSPTSSFWKLIHDQNDTTDTWFENIETFEVSWTLPPGGQLIDEGGD